MPILRKPLRILTAVPICDGHDSAVTTINVELARHGIEVIYLGYHCSATTIARSAIQEDVHAVGISSYNGGHIVFFDEVIKQLKARGGAGIPVFGGGGGTITRADERLMKRRGVDRIFFAGTPLNAMMEEIKQLYARLPKPDGKLTVDSALARKITLAEISASKKRQNSGFRGAKTFVMGVAGPGGAGKSTIIDEFTSRFLKLRPDGRMAILANDPSHPDTGGAILGDRVSAIYAQDDRVFFRSLATRGHLTGLSRAAPAAIEVLRASGQFDLILVESVGIGQESDPFRIFSRGRQLVDSSLLVLAPHYGGRIQLQKIGMLNGADFVAINKCDHPMALTARTEIGARIESNDRGQRLFGTVAARHFDTGVDRLFAAISALSPRKAR